MRAAPLMCSVTWTVTLSLTTAGSVGAQRSGLREVRDWGLAGATLAVVLPRDRSAAPDMRIGGGMAGYLTVYADRAGFFGIRIDGSILANGHSNNVAYSQGPSSYPVDMTVVSWIGGLRVGPQITLGLGGVQLYGFGTAGISYVATTTTYDDHGCRCYGSHTDWGDYHWSSELGAGMLLRLGGPSGKVNLDLGMRRPGKAFARYWTSDPGNTGSTVPQGSELELMVLHLGATVGLR